MVVVVVDVVDVAADVVVVVFAVVRKESESCD